MQILYEEDGDLKVGAVLAQAPASFQVESPHGRRSKVKAASVLLSFERPAGAELLGGAEKYAAALDAEFLWQCSGQREFGFQDLARDYVGREPTRSKRRVLWKLHSAPVHFYRRGQALPGRAGGGACAWRSPASRKAPDSGADGRLTAQLARFECPVEIGAMRDELLYAPDRNKPETRALSKRPPRDRTRAGAAVRALRPAAGCARFSSEPVPARILSARNAFPGARGADIAAGPAAGGGACLQPR